MSENIFEIILRENLHQFMIENRIFFYDEFTIERIEEKVVDGIDGYICYVNHKRTSKINIFVIKSKYNAWMRDKKIDIILE